MKLLLFLLFLPVLCYGQTKKHYSNNHESRVYTVNGVRYELKGPQPWVDRKLDSIRRATDNLPDLWWNEVFLKKGHLQDKWAHADSIYSDWKKATSTNASDLMWSRHEEVDWPKSDGYYIFLREYERLRKEGKLPPRKP